jgi:hypothetical protein
MKTKLLILFFIFPLFIFAQSKISGQVFDKETHEPVSNVAIYTDGGTNITLTDNEGRYNLIINPSESVYFRQLAYDFFVGVSDSLLINPVIYLTRNVVNLNEVVVSPNDAQNLLNKAILNLYARLQKNKTKSYLCHIEETTDAGGNREAYAFIDAELTKVNMKKRTLEWNIHLVQLEKKSILENSFRPEKSRIMQVGIFPQRISFNSELDNYVCEFYDNDDYQLTIKVVPKQTDKKHYRYYLYTINKRDTILTEYISQSFANSSEITVQKTLSRTLQTLNHFSRLKFAQNTLESYYLKEAQNIGMIKIQTNASICVFSFKINSKEIPVNSTISFKKKIKPFDYLLFETDFPSTPDFWKQFVK